MIRSLIRLRPLFRVLPSAAQTVPELADRARAAAPAVRATGASLRAAEERLFQARAAYGPTANLTATTTETRYRELNARFLVIASNMGIAVSEVEIRKSTEIVRQLSDDVKVQSKRRS